MAFRPRSQKRLRQLCAEVSPEDGVDPRDWIKSGRSPKPGHRKARQLCGQVADALRLALDHVDVVAVEPAPDTTRLVVTVRDPTSADPIAILDALDRSAGRLRAEVAAAITRRKAPLLVFRVVV